MNWLLIVPWWLLDSFIGLAACQALATLLLFWLHAHCYLDMYRKVEQIIQEEQKEEQQKQRHLTLVDPKQ